MVPILDIKKIILINRNTKASSLARNSLFWMWECFLFFRKFLLFPRINKRSIFYKVFWISSLRLYIFWLLINFNIQKVLLILIILILFLICSIPKFYSFPIKPLMSTRIIILITQMKTLVNFFTFITQFFHLIT